MAEDQLGHIAPEVLEAGWLAEACVGGAHWYKGGGRVPFLWSLFFGTHTHTHPHERGSRIFGVAEMSFANGREVAISLSTASSICFL